jgi:hypothetical protein
MSNWKGTLSGFLWPKAAKTLSLEFMPFPHISIFMEALINVTPISASLTFTPARADLTKKRKTNHEGE